MAEDTRAQAPYNFVPFSEQVIYRYDSADQIPGHHEMDENLKNGEIHVTISACTPLFVGNGSSHFVTDEHGNLCIPGSSLRGAIREYAQVLGLAPVRDTEDIRDEWPRYPGDNRYSADADGRHSIGYGLPYYDKDKLRDAIDYPRAIFGFIGTRGGPSLRSRVSFGDLHAVGNIREGRSEEAVMRAPSPSGCKTYLEGGKNYFSEKFRIRGFKQYWMKEAWAPGKNYELQYTTLRPVPEGSRFRGVIRYHNLKEDELGLLLWALRLEDGCFMSLGGGKPFGFGRVRLSIDSLLEFTPAGHYDPAGLCCGLEKVPEDIVDRYIGIYDTCAVKYWNEHTGDQITSLKDLSTIQDFFYMRTTIVEDGFADYMSEAEYIDAGKPMYTVRELRNNLPEREADERSQQAAQQAAQQEPEEERSMEDMLAALKNKFNSNSSVQVKKSKKKR